MPGPKIPVDAYDRAMTRKLASGTLSTIDNEVDTTTGTFKLRAVFPNDDEKLFPNQFVNVRMLLNVDQGAIVIPTSAVEQGQQDSFVYVVKSDGGPGGSATVSARNITLGPTEGERVAVTKGLAAGERVVVDGADKLKDGAKVYVQRPAGARPGGGAGKWGGAGSGDSPHRHHRDADGSSPGAGKPGGAPQ